MKQIKLTLLLMLALLLVACGGTETAVEPSTSETSASDEMMDDTMSDDEMADAADDESMADEEMMDETMEDDMAMTEHEEGMAELEETMEEMDDMTEEMDEEMDEEMAMSDAPAWMSIALTDVRTGETFSLADFAGKTVFVEPMATWCTNCRQQLGNVAAAKAQLGDSEDVVFVSLSVETNIGNGDLANYTEETGFDWIFAVATPEMLISLADTFGQTVTNPPSTPHFIIRPDGTTTDLTTGYEGSEELLQNIEAASQS